MTGTETSAIDRVLDSFEQAAQECVAEGDMHALVTISAIDQARAELADVRRAIRARNHNQRVDHQA